MAVISLDIHIEDLATVLALFDRIQVWRAPVELSEDYSEITSATDLPASMDGSLPAPFALGGKTLNITLNSADPVPVSFTGGPFTLQEVIQRINSLIPALASEAGTSTGKLRLTSPTTGTGSSLLVTGDAVAVLGLPTTKTNGKAARIVVVSPTVDYQCLAGAAITGEPGALLRGGSFVSGSGAGPLTVDGGNEPSNASINIGFRCAR